MRYPRNSWPCVPKHVTSSFRLVLTFLSKCTRNCLSVNSVPRTIPFLEGDIDVTHPGNEVAYLFTKSFTQFSSVEKFWTQTARLKCLRNSGCFVYLNEFIFARHFFKDTGYPSRPFARNGHMGQNPLCLLKSYVFGRLRHELCVISLAYRLSNIVCEVNIWDSIYLNGMRNNTLANGISSLLCT